MNDFIYWKNKNDYLKLMEKFINRKINGKLIMKNYN